MKTKNVTLNRSIIGAACAGAVLFATSSATAQNLYAANYTTGTIYQYTPDGSGTLFASGMLNPVGIAFDSAGDLFVGNSDNNVHSGATEFGNITEITPGGVQSTFASGIDPQGIAFNAAGDLFEADYQSGNIYEYAPNGSRTLYATGFSLPLAMTFDSAGNLFIGSGFGNGNGLITEITPGGTRSTFASSLSFPEGIAFNSTGTMFVANNGAGNIIEITPGGTQSTFATLSNSALPNLLAFNNAGTLFVTDNSGHIDEFTAGGTESTFATQSGGVIDGLAFAPVPEPSSLALAGLGGVALLFRRRKS